MISLDQKNTHAEYMILSSADNHPPMLYKDLPPDDIYSLVNHHRVAKDLWERVQLLMQGTSLTKQERECFDVPVFYPVDDLIACLNKAMAFLTVVASSRFPTTNNQLRTSSNPRNQATIQDGRVTVQQVQRRQGQNFFWHGKRRSNVRRSLRSGQYWMRKATCIYEIRIPSNVQAQTVFPYNAAFQTEDLDTYDSDYDDLSTA
ncbi:hypothetical protein Tco_0824126 [Tanacetum coccineum]|uniref:Uncharacterized protein n=1 Tax=Tanacetum coccineum TaxID=301880 RepID=A0ABQ5AMJ9_9ASTR